MKEYLMIGGPSDGQLVTFPGDPPPSYVTIPIPGDVGFGAVQYRRETLISRAAKEFFVYVTGDGDLIDRLIVGYSKIRHPEKD